MTTPFAGLILAGGEGRRWGGPKAWARLPDGRSFLDACGETLVAAGADPVVATLPHGSQADQRRIVLCALPQPGLDMLGSVRHGLARLLDHPDWQAVIVLPVDHPLVRAETVATLVAAGPPAAIPTLNGRHGHPVCLWREVVEQLCSGSLPAENLRQVLKAAPAGDVAVSDPGVRANCNTPQALQEALGAAGEREPSSWLLV